MSWVLGAMEWLYFLSVIISQNMIIPAVLLILIGLGYANSIIKGRMPEQYLNTDTIGIVYRELTTVGIFAFFSIITKSKVELMITLSLLALAILKIYTVLSIKELKSSANKRNI